MNDLKLKRKDNEEVFVVKELGWKYHHIGIPTRFPIENERYIPHLKMYVSGFETSPFGIEWMRFEDDCPLHEVIKTVPHIAFEVKNLDETLSKFDFEILTPPNSPSDIVRVAMILHNNAPVELMEFNSEVQK